MRTFVSTLLLASALAPCAFADEPAPTADPRYELAEARSGLYLSFAGGYAGGGEFETEAYGTSEAEGGWGLAGAFGSYFGDHARGEVALSYRALSLSGASVGYFGTPGGVPGWYTVTHEGDGLRTLSADLNVYVDIPVGDGPVQPYVGAGAGIGVASFDDGYYTDSSGYVSFTSHAMAGSSFRVGEKASLFLEGRYDWTSFTIESQNRGGVEEELDIGGFGIYAGVRFGL